MGPKITQELADVVARVMADGLGEEQLDLLVKASDRPDNCEGLEVPLVNAAIFDNLDSESRSRDVKMQRILKYTVKGLVNFVQVADLVLQAEHNKTDVQPGQIWDKLTDGINLTAQACHEVNIRRREMLKPKMQDKFKSLCSPKKPVTPKQLFGEDLAQTVKDLDEANKVTQKITVDAGRGKAGFPGYGRGKFPANRGSFRGRGRGGIFRPRGRGQGGFLGQRYPQAQGNQTQGQGNRQGQGKPKTSGNK